MWDCCCEKTWAFSLSMTMFESDAGAGASASAGADGSYLLLQSSDQPPGRKPPLVGTGTVLVGDETLIL